MQVADERQRAHPPKEGAVLCQVFVGALRRALEVQELPLFDDLLPRECPLQEVVPPREVLLPPCAQAVTAEVVDRLEVLVFVDETSSYF